MQWLQYIFFHRNYKQTLTFGNQVICPLHTAEFLSISRRASHTTHGLSPKSKAHPTAPPVKRQGRRGMPGAGRSLGCPGGSPWSSGLHPGRGVRGVGSAGCCKSAQLVIAGAGRMPGSRDELVRGLGLTGVKHLCDESIFGGLELLKLSWPRVLLPSSGLDGVDDTSMAQATVCCPRVNMTAASLYIHCGRHYACSFLNDIHRSRRSLHFKNAASFPPRAISTSCFCTITTRPHNSWGLSR
jgi:hypothetical protein